MIRDLAAGGVRLVILDRCLFCYIIEDSSSHFCFHAGTCKALAKGPGWMWEQKAIATLLKNSIGTESISFFYWGLNKIGQS